MVQRRPPSLDVWRTARPARFPQADLLERPPDLGACSSRIGSQIERHAQVTLPQILLAKLLSQSFFDTTGLRRVLFADGDPDCRAEPFAQSVHHVRLDGRTALVFQPRQDRPGNSSCSLEAFGSLRSPFPTRQS